MPEAQDILNVYLQVARLSRRRRKEMVRDRFLVLAAMVAMDLELWNVADLCRQTILRHNPGHLVRRFTTMRDAVDDEDFEALVTQLWRKYPFERVEFLLSRFHPRWAEERSRYESQDAFAQAMLREDPSEPEG